MSDHPLADFRALTFDCYGTLVDWESGILRFLRPWAEGVGVAAADEELLRAFAEAESSAEESNPTASYPDVLRAAHAMIAIRLGARPDQRSADDLAASVGDWPPFPDSREALERLKGMGLCLLITSNVDRASFARTQAALGVEFDAVVTAEDVGTYKPSPGHFHRAGEILQQMGVAREAWLHVAQSLHHDHVPAKALGLATCWIDRRRGRPGGATRTPSTEVQPDFRFDSMATFAEAVTGRG